MPRRKHDFYQTPQSYLTALGSELCIPQGSRVLDACVGDGDIARWITREYRITDVLTNDIDRKRKARRHCDARQPQLYDRWQADFWITNPPFNAINSILRLALENCTNVITLARLSVLEPTKARREIYQYFQPDMLIVLPRYCFRLNDKGKRATDSVTCAWIGWGPQVPHLTTVWTQPPPEEK